MVEVEVNAGFKWGLREARGFHMKIGGLRANMTQDGSLDHSENFSADLVKYILDCRQFLWITSSD